MLDYALIRSSRRSLSLQIDGEGNLIVRSPRLYPLSKIEAFIQEKSSWIEKHQGQRKKLARERAERASFYYLFGVMYSRDGITDEALKNTLKKELKSYIHSSLPRLLRDKVLPKNIANIRINSARTRWGSCSSKGNLSFSYRLAAYPKETIDAVILHEVAHLTHAHHGKMFWTLLLSWLPDYKMRVEILKNPLHLSS